MNRGRRPQRFRHPQHNNDQAFHRRRSYNQFTPDRLQELLTVDPNEVTFRLASNVRALQEFFNQTMDYGFTELFIRVLRRSMQSVSLKEKNNQILTLLLHSNFPLNVSQILAAIDLSSIGLVGFLLNIVFIMKSILMRYPSEYLKTLQIIGIMNVTLVDLVRSNVDGAENLQMKYKELQNLLQRLTKGQRKQGPEAVLSLPQPEIPPEDFRDLEMMPTVEAIHSKEKIFLRKNQVKGAYDDVDHYLDVQFRLMREDFFVPLRNGIKEYLALEPGQKHQHIGDLRIYHQVNILYPMCSFNGIAYKVSFDVSHLRINWEQSKRLNYGSLVCLTPDDFQTVYFATVTERKVDELKEGLVDLLFFSHCEDISRRASTTVFIMAETTAYFEAYRPILAALKEIHNDNMPFQDYIIFGKSDVKPPSYLTRQQNLKMNLACITDDSKMVYNSKQNMVHFDPTASQTDNLSLNILDDAWPSAEVLKLNDAQLQALQNALTKEFSLTQGPPGTGKTYIGLKIVKFLCANSNIWRGNGKSPMLIVCYTNQALDNFLEGIAEFLEGGILRVGGRSSSEVLIKYSLSKTKETYRLNKAFTSEFVRNKYSTIQERNDLKLEIEQITNQIKQTKKGILQEDFLEAHMGQFYDWLVRGFEDNYGHQKSGKMSLLTQWLGYGNIEIFEIEADNGNEDYPEEAGEDEVDVITEVDFIQQNRMIGNDESLAENFAALEIKDDEVIALKLDDLDREIKSSRDGFEKTRKEKRRLKKQLQRDLNSNTMLKDEEVDQIQYHDFWLMAKQRRWKLYRRWVASLCQQLRDQIVQKEVKYNAVTQVYKELQRYEDGEIMKNSLIIGMTTTGAAKYHAILQEIQPKIIIVEEAAEILEAHVVTALNPMCEQLILIGDHKQLRPNPNVYELARNYNLEVSLFERMVLNECHVKCLSYQHRMRPEISQLLRPIYPDLQDHTSVTKYANIKGVASSVYFIQHNEPEETHKESSSYTNLHEACYLVELCNYLLKQGYNPSQITILTAYTSQLFQMKNLLQRKPFKGVKLTVIDNYQGEENDIILLSLVRNNVDKKVGFLKIDNRVCVALSRAKMGFYVIGNFEVLSEQSKLWKSILLMLKSQDLVGYALTLCCQNHPNQKIQVREVLDFAQSPEGGCLKPCESRLECGHMCKRSCHPVDDHDTYKCLEVCTKIAPDCQEKHKCIHVCSEECIPCMKMMRKTIPSCNHQQTMGCSENPNTFVCQESCQKILQCGHQCMERCSDFCTFKCSVLISKTHPCKHTVKTPCFKQNDVCPVPCSKNLDCGHLCNGTCGGCSERRIHSTCSHGCCRILVCGHQCSNKQCNVCSPCLKPCQNRCVHSKCMKPCGELCVPCKEPCEWRCEHYQCTKYCHESCDRPKCDKPCSRRLYCGHPCVGLCGEKCPRLCGICNREELTETFFGTEEEEDACFVELEDCGHIFEKSGLDRWMSLETDGEIQLKVCPRCKVPIRRNLRYGQIVNKMLMDIDMVKDRLIGDREQINAIILKIETDIEKVSQENCDCLKDELKRSKNGKLTLFYWQSFSYRISFLLAFDELMEKDSLKDDSSLQKHCEDLTLWLLSHREIFSKTELEEIEMELERVGKILQFYEVRKNLMSVSKQSDTKYMIEHGLLLLTSKDYSSVREEVLKIAKDLFKIIPVSDQERIDIVKAMELSRGHWFKCPNGHIYAIGDCGGAISSSTCPECGSRIGGTAYQLAHGNTLAGEMDGADRPAWS